MKKITHIMILAAAGFISSGPAEAADTNPPPTVAPSGSKSGFSLSSNTTCETNTSGDSTEGYTSTVCVDEDGSSTWYESEWGDGYKIVDQGIVVLEPDGTFSTASIYSESYL